MISGFKSNRGFTLVEVSVVVIILTLAFMVFLKALNTGKSVRVNSEIRTIQGSILSDIENQIRSRRFDENTNAPWSNVLGTIEDTVNVLLLVSFIKPSVSLDDVDIKLSVVKKEPTTFVSSKIAF